MLSLTLQRRLALGECIDLLSVSLASVSLPEEILQAIITGTRGHEAVLFKCITVALQLKKYCEYDRNNIEPKTIVEYTRAADTYSCRTDGYDVIKICSFASELVSKYQS